MPICVGTGFLPFLGVTAADGDGALVDTLLGPQVYGVEIAVHGDAQYAFGEDGDWCHVRLHIYRGRYDVLDRRSVARPIRRGNS